MNKQLLRKKFRKIIRNIPNRKERSEKLLEIIKKSNKFLMANSVLIYVDVYPEIPTREVIKECFSLKKRVYIPDIEHVRVGEITSFKNLKNYKNTDYFIPDKFETVLPKIDLNIMPGIVFDKEMYRIGSGSGWYDRYIPTGSSNYNLGLVFKEQVVDYIPFEKHDSKVDELIII